MIMRTWQLRINEDELKALIHFHSINHADSLSQGKEVSNEISSRIHDLTKRLNKAESEPDLDTKDIPKPEVSSDYASTKPATGNW